MNWQRPTRRREAQLRNTLDKLATPQRRACLPVLIWRWRKELALLTAAAVLFMAILYAFGIACAVVGLSVMIGALSPPWSERLRAFGWQLITPHLLRAGLREAWIQSRTGRHPAIVRVTREGFGERVRLRCPPGTCAEDFEAARDVLRAACRAADVQVTRDERRSHMVTVDVIRRFDDLDPVDSEQSELSVGR
ncbi:MAG TPA: hypothetical protein VGL63_06770 [Streptosporangiaceae bacterium]|jgi:hypothetical protein